MRYSSLSTFKKSIKTLENFITDREWLSMLKIDIALNPTLEKELVNLIHEIDYDNIKVEYLNTLIGNLRTKFYYYKELAFKEKDIIPKWSKYRHAYAYYGFIEVITEGSIISDKLLDRLKAKYGHDYLNILKQVDEENPSILTNFKKKNSNLLLDDDIKLYLAMKKWQDDQHMFHDDVIASDFTMLINKANNFIYEKCPHLKKIKGYPLLSLYILDSMPLVPLSLLSRFVVSGLDKKLTSVFGGKGVGLAILNSLGYRVEDTYLISVSSLKNKSYLTFLDKLPNKHYAVRSSATTEDSRKHSFAGLFTTVLNVSKKDLNKNITKVYNSVNNKRVQSYVEHFKTENPLMAIVLQEFREPSYAGVWIGSKLNEGRLEWVSGNGEKLVSGSVKPKLEIWPSKEGIKAGNKFVGKECLRLQKKIKSLADLEWAIIDDKLYWVQYRPVTKVLDIVKKPKSKNVLGIPSSPGKVTGKPIFLNDVNINEFEDGAILLTDYTDPEWVPIILKSKGIITAEGGFLSHTAIICRELGLPCITGVGYQKIDEIKTYKQIAMDGSEGTIKIIQK